MNDDQAYRSAGVREGDTIAGKYRIDKILGMGGMGVVVAARHIQLDERVAIKFLLPQALSQPETVARFAREGRAAVKIKSEHVARVSDVGTLENGAPYMIMEYLEGADLSDWVQKKGALPIEEAVDFVLQACEAIAEAHSLGIVHRDLKPANLFVITRPDGALSIKVLDFGISKATGPIAGADLTQTSAVMGSPLYMSPEQMIASRDVDARSDIWALGVVLYELVTASPPFMGDTLPELIAQILSEAPVPLRTKRPDATPELERIILRCLEKDRDKRYSSVGPFAVDLLQFAPRSGRLSVDRISGIMRVSGRASNEPVPTPPPEVDPSVPANSAGTPVATKASWSMTGRSSRTGAAVWVGAGVVAVVLGVTIFRAPRPQTTLTPVPRAAENQVVQTKLPELPEVPSVAPAAIGPVPSAPATPSALAVPAPTNSSGTPTIAESKPPGVTSAQITPVTLKKQTKKRADVPTPPPPAPQQVPKPADGDPFSKLAPK